MLSSDRPPYIGQVRKLWSLGVVVGIAAVGLLSLLGSVAVVFLAPMEWDDSVEDAPPAWLLLSLPLLVVGAAAVLIALLLYAQWTARLAKSLRSDPPRSITVDRGW